MSGKQASAHTHSRANMCASILAVVVVTACGGGNGGSSGPAPSTPTSPAATTFTFPVVATSTTPQGCQRTDGKEGVSAVVFYETTAISDSDLIVLPCNTAAGRRVFTAQPGRTVQAVHVDAAGTVVAQTRDGGGNPVALFAMLPGSNQQIELSGPYPPTEFIGVFGDRAIFLSHAAGHTLLLSATIAQVPTLTVLAQVAGLITVHDKLVGGRLFIAMLSEGANASIQYMSMRPNGTDRLSLRSAALPPNPIIPLVEIRAVLRDREVIYSEQTTIAAVPTLRMLAIDLSGSDVLLAELGVEGVVPVPGAPDRLVFIARYPNPTTSTLHDVNAERGNVSVRMLQLPSISHSTLSFSQGRLYLSEATASQTQNVSWLGEGGSTPRTVLTAIRRTFHVTDQALVFTRTPQNSGTVSYARSDLDGRNEHEGSPVPRFFDEVPILAGEKIFYLREANTVGNHIVSMDLATGVETVVYRPNPAQDGLRFFRSGGRLIAWRSAVGIEPGWIDSFDFNGNDLRRLDNGSVPISQPGPL